MSFFEDAFIGAKEIGSAVSKKTGQLVDTAKLRMTAADINNEINKRYEALGKAVYEARKSGTDIDGIIGECVVSIDALNDRLDEVNDRLAGMKNRTCCTSCGASIDTQALYCSRCGAKIEPRRRTPTDRRPEPAAAQTAAKAETLSRLCSICLKVTVITCAVFNLAQLACAEVLLPFALN